MSTFLGKGLGSGFLYKAGAVVASILLLEDSSSYLLMETGDALLLE